MVARGSVDVGSWAARRRFPPACGCRCPGAPPRRWISTRPAICCRAPPSARRRPRSALWRRMDYAGAVDRLLAGVRRDGPDAGAGLDQPGAGRAAPPAAGRGGRSRRPASTARRCRSCVRSRSRAASCATGGSRRCWSTDQPLVERMTLFWHNHFTSSFAEGALRAGAVSPERAVPPRGARQLRDAPEGRGARSGDADLSRRRAHRGAPAQRELRPRAARAVHPGRGPLQRGRHQGRRARLHRLVDRPRDRRVPQPRRSSTTTARRPSSARPAASTATTSSPSCCAIRAPPRRSSRSCGASSCR